MHPNPNCTTHPRRINKNQSESNQSQEQENTGTANFDHQHSAINISINRPDFRRICIYLKQPLTLPEFVQESRRHYASVHINQPAAGHHDWYQVRIRQSEVTTNRRSPTATDPGLYKQQESSAPLLSLASSSHNNYPSQHNTTQHQTTKLGPAHTYRTSSTPKATKATNILRSTIGRYPHPLLHTHHIAAPSRRRQSRSRRLESPLFGTQASHLDSLLLCMSGPLLRTLAFQRPPEQNFGHFLGSYRSRYVYGTLLICYAFCGIFGPSLMVRV